MMSRLPHWLMLLLAVSFTAGCGQKGELYLPDEAPAESQQQDDDEDDGG